MCSPARTTTTPGLQRWVQGWLAQELVLHCNVWSFPVLRLGRLPSIKRAYELCPCAVLGETPCFGAGGSPGLRDLPSLTQHSWGPGGLEYDLVCIINPGKSPHTRRKVNTSKAGTEAQRVGGESGKRLSTLQLWFPPDFRPRPVLPSISLSPTSTPLLRDSSWS